ncbi:MAG: arabinose isomerase [Lachnospiraceae bacterium]
MERKERKKARVGIYTMGLKHYWNQFPGLKERLIHYGEFLAEKINNSGAAEVYFYGLVDSPEEGDKAGDYFNEKHVDLIFAHAGTYVTSASVVPVHQKCCARTVILNLQPAAKINYQETSTGEWLSQCGACPVPEIANAFHRMGIECEIINGLLGLEETPAIAMADEVTSHMSQAVRAWKEIHEWVQAAMVKRNLEGAKFGFLGNTYNGMLDMYSDFTMFSGETKSRVEILEMCDLNEQLQLVTEEEVKRKTEEIEQFFVISEDSSADPLAKKPTAEQLDWSARVAAAQDKLVEKFELDALCYYYHGTEGGNYEKLQSGWIVGNSLLTSQGIPCAGEGDLKTCLAMKICDLLGVGGSFCEIVVTDYIDGTILLGHDGPFHLEIAKGKPFLRGMGLYHGKLGNGVSVEAKVRTGDITNFGCTQTRDGRLKFLITEALATDGEIMQIGNTQTPVKFKKDPDSYMDEWFSHAPTHHFAMSVGKNESLFAKTCKMLGIEAAVLDK